MLARVDDATIAYIADADARAIRIVDTGRMDELATFTLPGAPAQLVMLADHRIAASLRDRDEVIVLAGSGLPGAPFTIAEHLAVATEPIGLALAPDDRTLLVTSGWGHTLTTFAVPSLTLANTWDTAPEPRAVTVTDEGRYAYVSHAVGQDLERIDLENAMTHWISLAGREEHRERHSEPELLPRAACQGFALAKSIAPAGRIYAPEVQVFSGEPTVASSGYGGGGGRMEPEVFDVAVVDEDQGTALRGSLDLLSFASSETRCVLPRAAAASAEGSLFVACLGDNRVVELDGVSAMPASAEIRTWVVPAGPTGIAIDEPNHRAIVWSQLAHKVTRIRTRGPTTIETVALEDRSAMTEQIKRGRELFATVSDPRISGDGRACESCHPDGRQDTLVWSTPFGPRQTPMLAGRIAATAPYGWNGDATDLAAHLKRTFARLHGTGLTGADRDALIAYVMSLPAPPAEAPDAELVAQGEAIFGSEDAGCSSCHGDDGRSPDGLRHDVKSATEGDRRRKFDTPSLASLGGTAPYYHDGRFTTLRQLLVKSRGAMGQRRALTSQELDALEAYLRSL
ncbi:MAG: Surface antigen protein [Myxococcales bacterium]|nr:Surface antigen protein [Myxococcales bacterium]